MFADDDRAPQGVAPLAPMVLRCFDAASKPKTLLMFGGSEHSRGMFAAPYGPDVIEAIINFVARGI